MASSGKGCGGGCYSSSGKGSLGYGSSKGGKGGLGGPYINALTPSNSYTAGANYSSGYRKAPLNYQPKFTPKDYNQLEKSVGTPESRKNPFEGLSQNAYENLKMMMGKDYMKSCPKCWTPLLSTMAICPQCGK